jgi:hypothetical protein
MAELPSQEYLKSRIEYNPETGEARWKPVDESYGSTWKVFNSRYAGKILSKGARIRGVAYASTKLIYLLHYGKLPISNIVFANKNSSDRRIQNLVTVADVDYKISKIPNVTRTDNHTNDMDTELMSIVRFDHRTGKLFWLPRGDNNFDSQYAGKEAGFISNGYRRIKYNNKSYTAHRLAWYLYYAVDPGKYQIDHEDSCKTNNCISNLRLANSSLNNQNKSVNKGYYKRANSYVAAIYIRRTRISLGSFSMEAEAKQAYEEAMAKYKPVYKFTDEEQALLDELYENYPHVTRELQHRCHELQVKALNHYIEGAAQ